MDEKNKFLKNVFIVNDNIVVKLERDIPEIYVGGEWFRHCSEVAVNIPLEKIEQINYINSIDELDELRDKDETDTIDQHEIASETRFFVHCSNLKCWIENKYNTILLHRKLLKKK